jgi:hypothetical protein
MYKRERTVTQVEQVEDEQVLTRFLLGDLAPADRQAIEDRLIEDPAFFESLCALEDEVILKWHRGELSPEDWQLFTQSYLTSPPRQARVASVRELIDAAERWKHEAEPQPSLWGRLPRWLTVPRQVPQFALAAAGAMVIAVVPALLYQTRDAMRRLQDAEREITSLRQQSGGAQHLAAVFTLAPVTVRGQDTDATNVVRIPRDAAEVWLRFEMADPGTPAGFDAILEPLDRRPATTPRPARLEPTATGMLVTLTLAASDLPEGDYVLRLRRLTAGDSSDIVATRTLRVTRD